MAKNSRKGTKRSSRKRPEERKGELVGFGSQDEVVDVQLRLPIAEVLAGTRGALEALALEAGLLLVNGLLEEEVCQLAGERYVHDEQARGTRWGSEDGYMVFGGRKVAIKRPRVRMKDGGEAPLERYRLFQAEGRMQEEVAQRVLKRVATRGYEHAITDVCDGYGIKKSSVSRHWKAASTKQMQELVEKPLGDMDLAVIMLDGVYFKKYAIIAALGVDHEGSKHVLGLWQGASENSAVVGALLDNLIGRGLDPERKYLFVLDGSRALRKAVISRFGKDCPVQRCHIHKIRNILDHLPKEYHAGVRMRLKAAWGMKHYDDARKALLAVQVYLRDLCPGAADSLEEAFEETLTLHRLEVAPALRRSLQSTNLIENIFSTLKDLCRNVKRWRSAEMAWRWAGAGFMEAQKRFRRVRGCAGMPALLNRLDRKIDQKENVA